MASDCIPSNWYGFESSFRYDERGRPQRNYVWKVNGVQFSYIEAHTEAGISFEEAARQHAEHVSIEEAKKVLKLKSAKVPEPNLDIPF